MEIANNKNKSIAKACNHKSRKRLEIKVFEITSEDILILPDKDFNPAMVCIVAGCGGEVGRAIAIAASANNLMTVGLDINEEEGKKTQKLARDIGGQMIFIETDFTSEEGLEYSVAEAAKLGYIKYVANIVKIKDIVSIGDVSMEKYDLLQRTVLRVPLYISKLTMPYMKKSHNGAGVIGNLISINNTIWKKQKRLCRINDYVLGVLKKSIPKEKGEIRFFSLYSGPIHGHKLTETTKDKATSSEKIEWDIGGKKNTQKDVATPIEIANMFIFGFSQYSSVLIEKGLVFDGKSL